MPLSEKIEKDLELLDKYDSAYYNQEPLVPDSTYDLFKDYVYSKLPPDHPRLDKVGHEPCSTWPKETHEIFMGSQNKVSNEDAIRSWVEKTNKLLGFGVEYVLQYKIDGFSLEVQYSASKLNKAVTRGNGLVGENITPNALLFREVPHSIPVDKDITIRGEAFLKKEHYELIQKKTGDHYKNIRNAACGISRRQDGKFSKYLHVLAYDVGANVNTELKKLEILSKLHFVTVPTFNCRTIDDILKVYREVKEVRESLPYEIDGLVLKVNSIEQQNSLGIKRSRPEAQVALKFDSDQALTTLNKIILQVGRTGKITPVALLAPVDLMGSTVKKATLHNFDYIKQNFIGEGAEVIIEKKGDIIPQIVDIASAGEDYETPKKCPSCGGDLVFDNVNLWCYNVGCKERETNRINYWVETLDMKGFSNKFVNKLWESEKIRAVSDIYKLSHEDFENLEGIGKKTVDSFFKVLEGTSEMLLDKFITALGIPSCSTSTAKVLVDNFKDWERIQSLTPADLEKLPGFAKVSSETICIGIQEISGMAQELLKVIKIIEAGSGPLAGMSFCVTGSLKSMPRKKFQDMIRSQGGDVKDRVSEDLSYLVTNDKDSGSSKNVKAQKFSIPIISEDEFYALLGQQTPEKKPEEIPGVKLEFENIFE